jgi:hypothetical protein
MGGKVVLKCNQTIHPLEDLKYPGAIHSSLVIAVEKSYMKDMNYIYLSGANFVLAQINPIKGSLNFMCTNQSTQPFQ